LTWNNVSYENATEYQRLGYVFHQENRELTKRYFREPPGHSRTHIHVRRAGSFGEQFALLFRDFLRLHANVAEQYGACKTGIALQYCNEREAVFDNPKGAHPHIDTGGEFKNRA